MGRPLNKRYFGPPTATGNEIKVQFHNGTSSVPGWIVKQKGSKRFVCSDTALTQATCVLTDAAAGALTAGQMSITVDDNSTARQVTKISGRVATLDNGTRVAWDFTGTGATVDIEEAGDDSALTNADNFEGDVE
jgi:hypothetical protein